MAQLDGKVAVVTAGGAGIGQGIVWLLAERGARVVATDISADGLAETQAQAEASTVQTVTADVTTEAGARASVDAALAAFGRLDILVNVVGGSRPGKNSLEMSREDWEAMLLFNLTSAFLMCRSAIPAMSSSGGGAIVNISSGAGIHGMNRNPGYVAAKGGLVAYTKALAMDHADQHIRANVIAPGAILTPLMQRNRRPDEIAALGRMNLVGRLGTPRDIAATVAFLASDDGAFVNGELIEVSGGRKANI